MRTLNLSEAADFLKMTPEGLRRKAACGEIPGAKPGRRWCFCEDDLAEYVRSLYAGTANVSQGVVGIDRRTTWRSVKEVTCGGLESVMVEDEYNKALGLATS
jgi:excisionase family DNA binding protein